MSQSNPFSYVTFAQAKASLALRLNDASNLHWTDAENGLYIKEALRLWNCLTQQWIQDWSATYNAGSFAWQSTANSANSLLGSNPTSPRFQTLTSADIYTMVQYHLLEPPTGVGTWTGTSQFSLADLAGAFQERRDAILQQTACNVGPIASGLSIATGTNRVQLPDSTSSSVLDVRRVRYIPSSGDPVTLFRDDGMAMEYFNSDFPQTSGYPLSWDVLAGPPQFLTFDALASDTNTLDVLAVLSGGNIADTDAAPLLIPDDFSWVIKFAVLSDVMSKESESTDLVRAAYCEQRYQEGIKIMAQMPWLTQARINGVIVDTPSFFDMDRYDYGWQSSSSASAVVVRGGIDVFAVSPTIPPGSSTSVTLSLVGNTPLPSSDSGYVQVSRDVLTSILDEAQHLAAFKHGGQEFQDTMPLHQGFLQAAMETNRRLLESGIFATTLRPPLSRENQSEPRTALEE